MAAKHQQLPRYKYLLSVGKISWIKNLLICTKYVVHDVYFHHHSGVPLSAVISSDLILKGCKTTKKTEGVVKNGEG